MSDMSVGMSFCEKMDMTFVSIMISLHGQCVKAIHFHRFSGKIQPQHKWLESYRFGSMFMYNLMIPMLLPIYDQSRGHRTKLTDFSWGEGNLVICKLFLFWVAPMTLKKHPCVLYVIYLNIILIY